MRRLAWIALLLLPLALPAPILAQEVDFPEYTDAQRWERLAQLMLGWNAAFVAFGEEHGMTPEETGEWIGEFFTDAWLGGIEATQFLRGLHRNFLSLPGAELEVLEQTPLSVTARFNRPLDAFLGPGARAQGVDVADIDAMVEALDATIADYVGIDMQKRRDGDHQVVTLTTEYGPIVASDRIRWNRGAYLSWLTSLQLMSLRKESGMTAQQMGAADAELYAPTWTAQTPWQLFRGMVWNQMTDPNTDCDVISATPREVRARCREHYRALVEQNQERFGVTPEDVFESGRAFAAGVADYLGMRWAETSQDGYRNIIVTVR